MWDLIVSVPDHCLSFYFPCILKVSVMNVFIFLLQHTRILRIQCRLNLRQLCDCVFGRFQDLPGEVRKYDSLFYNYG